MKSASFLIFPVLLLLLTCATAFNEKQEYSGSSVSDINGSVYDESEFGNYTSAYLSFATKEQSTFKSWQIRTLEYINSLRERGNIPPLRMNEQLHRDVQEWTRNVACKGEKEQHDVKGFQASKFKIDLQREYRYPATRSKTKLFRKTISDWFQQYKDFDCEIPITLEDMYTGADHFQQLGYYAVIMGKQYEKVGFGIAVCPDTGSVLVIARFDYSVRNFYKLIAKEIIKQGLTTDEILKLDMSRFVACPDDFSY